MTPQTVLAVHSSGDLFGSDRMFLESIVGLRSAGHNVVVALPATGPMVPELHAIGARVVVLPMLVLRRAHLRPSGWGILARDGIRGFMAAHRLLRKLHPSAVYVSTITLPHWPVAARLHRAHVVAHVHEAEGYVHRLVNAAAYLPLAAAHTVIVNSDYSKHVLGESLPPLRDRAQVILNGVASPDDPMPPREAITGALRVCYVGRLSPRKGPDLVLKAARILALNNSPVQITLVGSVFAGNEWYEQELRELAAELPEGASVTFAGFAPNIWPHLAGADVAVVPSRLDESFGNTAVEGVLALRPVVASDLSGLREAVGRYSTAYLVAPDDEHELVAALRQVRTNWSSLHERVAAERIQALNRHAPASYRASISRAVTGIT